MATSAKKANTGATWAKVAHEGNWRPPGQQPAAKGRDPPKRSAGTSRKALAKATGGQAHSVRWVPVRHAGLPAKRYGSLTNEEKRCRPAEE